MGMHVPRSDPVPLSRRPQPENGSHTRSPGRAAWFSWSFVALTLVADIGLTVMGLANGFVESNPVAVVAFQKAGVIGLFLLKFQAVAVAALGWRVLPRPARVVAPACLGATWSVAVLANLALLFGRPL